MKKVIIPMLLLVAFAVSARSQTTQPKLTEEQKKELKEKMDAYKAKLNLSPEQQSDMEDVNVEYLEALSQIKESGGSRLSKYKKFKQANKSRDKKMKEILNKEQYKIYKEQQEEFKEELKARRTGR